VSNTGTGTEPVVGSHDGGYPDGQQHRGRRRRRTTLWTIATVMAIAVGAGGYVLGTSSRTAQHAPAAKIATAEVVRRNLVNTKSVAGTLGYSGQVTVTGQIAGTLTQLPSPGTVVSRGKKLYEVDGQGVILFYGPEPAYRDLQAGEHGRDVLQFEQNLSALGYRGFSVDDQYDADTAAAVRRWQRNHGWTVTGTVEKGRVVYAAGELRVSEDKTSLGSPAGPGTPVLAASSDRQYVHVDLDIGDQQLVAKGAKVTVTLPDGKTIKGTVGSISKKVTTTPSSDGGNKSTVGVDIDLGRDAAGALTQSPVTVALENGHRDNVLTVPLTALLALSEGGYGVQVIRPDGTSTLVPVTTGMFADGQVEVSGTGLRQGQTVGVAS
jgi:peptidoglycan hydrolase-like protein with peptidoglycan-binding domain